MTGKSNEAETIKSNLDTLASTMMTNIDNTLVVRAFPG